MKDSGAGVCGRVMAKYDFHYENAYCLVLGLLTSYYQGGVCSGIIRLCRYISTKY